MTLEPLRIARLSAAFFLVTAAGGASAAQLYVSPSGSDGTKCTQAAPCRQIRRALQVVNPGDVVNVADGSYLGFSVRELRTVTIRATGANAVVTPTTDRPDNRDTIFIQYSSDLVLDGLRSFNANRAAIRVSESHRITIRNGVFGNNQMWGIFTDFSDDLLIENNECFGSVVQHGIYVSNSGDRPVVRNNRLHDNKLAGVQLNADLTGGGDGIISNALVEKNIIYNNGAGGGGAINMDGLHGATIRNNLLTNNHASGITNYQHGGAKGPRDGLILHNTIEQAWDGRWALVISNTTGPMTVKNNVLYHPNPARGGITYLSSSDVANTDSGYNIVDRVSPDDEATVLTLAQWKAKGREPHSLSATPSALFVNPKGGDYHSATGSPAIDAGQTLAAVTVDLEGNPRPQGGASDIGAYEAKAPRHGSLSIDDVTVARLTRPSP